MLSGSVYYFNIISFNWHLPRLSICFLALLTLLPNALEVYTFLTISYNQNNVSPENVEAALSLYIIVEYWFMILFFLMQCRVYSGQFTLLFIVVAVCVCRRIRLFCTYFRFCDRFRL